MCKKKIEQPVIAADRKCRSTNVGRRRQEVRRKKLTWNANDVTHVFDYGHLEAETDTQEWDLLLSSPLGGQDHAFSAALAETTWNEDTPKGLNSDQHSP